jgi:hypothetical protein
MTLTVNLLMIVFLPGKPFTFCIHWQSPGAFHNTVPIKEEYIDMHLMKKMSRAWIGCLPGFVEAGYSRQHVPVLALVVSYHVCEIRCLYNCISWSCWKLRHQHHHFFLERLLSILSWCGLFAIWICSSPQVLKANCESLGGKIDFEYRNCH